MSCKVSLLERMRTVDTARTGSILVCRNPDRYGGIRAIQSRGATWGFDFEVLINSVNLCILYHHGNMATNGGARVCLENGDIILSTGVFCFRGNKGLRALKEFYENFDTSKPNA